MHYQDIVTQAVLASNLATSSGQNVVDLSGNKWTLSSPVLNSTVPASLPSQVHLDLYRAGIISKSDSFKLVSVLLTEQKVTRKSF